MIRFAVYFKFTIALWLHFLEKRKIAGAFRLPFLKALLQPCERVINANKAVFAHNYKYLFYPLIHLKTNI